MDLKDVEINDLLDLANAIEGMSPRAKAILGINKGDGRRTNRRSSAAPDPAGARRGVVHPNDLDKAVLNFLVGQKDKVDVKAIFANIESNFPDLKQTQVAKSLKWLIQISKVGADGKGRGTMYKATSTDNTLPAPDYDGPVGEPTAKSAIKLVMNELEPGEKIAPKDAIAQAMSIFPGHFTNTSFGAVFSQLAKSAEVQFTGSKKKRLYFRGGAKLKDAAERPTTTTDTTTDTKSNEDQEAATG